MARAHADDHWELARVASRIGMFYVDCHRYPDTLEELVRTPRDCPNWGPDPYFDGIPVDRWGHEWKYELLAPDRFRLRSLGADGREGGVGDDLDSEWIEPDGK